MLATLEKTDIITSDTTIDGETSNGAFGAYELEIPQNVQSSLDDILDYYKCACLKPVIHAQGTPLDVCATLAREVKTNLPNNLQIQGKELLDFMIREIVSYCRDTSAKSLTLNFSFERM